MKTSQPKVSIKKGEAESGRRRKNWKAIKKSPLFGRFMAITIVYSDTKSKGSARTP
jgi:hypothetical protein